MTLLRRALIQPVHVVLFQEPILLQNREAVGHQYPGLDQTPDHLCVVFITTYSMDPQRAEYEASIQEFKDIARERLLGTAADLAQSQKNNLDFLTFSLRRFLRADPQATTLEVKQNIKWLQDTRTYATFEKAIEAEWRVEYQDRDGAWHERPAHRFQVYALRLTRR